MTLSDRDPNGHGSGRASRASNPSSMSRAASKPPATAGEQDLFAPGIQSMLRTTTEMGNVMGLTGGTSDLANVPRAPGRRGASSRMSTTSSISTRSAHHQHQRQRHSSISGGRHSMPREHMQDGPQWVPDTLSPTVMNLPGSSPLVPVEGQRRDSHRSHSMTTASGPMQPPSRLSANRSMGSLQGNGEPQQPGSPLRHPQPRFARYPQRPASPAWSDVPGSQPNRLYRQVHQGQHHHHNGQGRMRMPSDASLGYRDGVQDMLRGPSRSSTPGLAQGHSPNEPPLPPLTEVYYPALQQAHPVEHARMMNRSLKGSMSSGSTNMRTDSETPSSDAPFPPTPKDNINTPMRGGTRGMQQMSRRAPRRLAQEEASGQPAYYDYSEPFEGEEIAVADPDRVHTGFVQAGKDKLDIVQPKGPTLVENAAQPLDIVTVANPRMPSLPELAASPVGRRGITRLTREVVLEGIGPASTTSDFSATRRVSGISNEQIAARVFESHASPGQKQDESRGHSLPATTSRDQRRSVASQPGSSLIDSSTIDFAVRYSIPAMTGPRSPPDLPQQDLSTLGSPSSPAKSTEDGMSELIAGYEHTDSQEGVDPTCEQYVAKVNESNNTTPCREDHVRKSSEGQSFKSCAAMPESASPAASPATQSGRHVAQIESVDDFLKHEVTPKQQQDVSMHKMRSGVWATDLTSPIPVVKSANLSENEPLAPTVPITSPRRAVLRKPVPSQVTNSITSALKARSISKASVKQGTASTSGSSSTLGASQQPPQVPPRDSSKSKDAQRVNAVSGFLLRRCIPARLRRAMSRTHEEVDVPCAAPTSVVTGSLEQSSDDVTAESSLHTLNADTKTPKKALSVANEDRLKQTSSSTVVDDRTPQVPPRLENLPGPSRQDLSVLSLRAEMPDFSSVYSPENVSMDPGRDAVHHTCHPSAQSVVAKLQDSKRPISQTVTHLSWHGRRSFGLHQASASEPQLPLPSVQEDSTTDLRLSGYRYNAHYHLPDLKEESHEDSSLNTSASNLKHSHFRFPYSGGGPSIRASTDDAIVFSRKSSLRSQQKSDVGQAHNLPSLEFSQGNLLEKVRDGLGRRFSRSLGDLRLEPTITGEALPPRANSAGGVVDDSDDNGQKRPVGRGGATNTRGNSQKYVAEVDRIDVPDTVESITRVWTEAQREDQGEGELQGIKEEFPAEAQIMEHALKEIKRVQSPSQKRSSARLRAMPGRSRMLMMDDDVYEHMEWNKGAKRCEGETEARAQGKNDAAATTTPTTPTTVELQPPSPAVLRPRSNTVAGNQILRVSAESGLSSRRSLRSVDSSPTVTDTRPWNSDRNYPWATSSLPSVDISLPSPVAIRNSPRPGPSHLRNRLSTASSSTFDSTYAATASPFGNTAGSQAHRNAHRYSGKGLGGDQAHAVGERYPTCALDPPTRIFRNADSCDGSDDENLPATRTKTKLGLRKRISSATRTTTHKTPHNTRSKVNAAELASPATVQETSSTILQDSTRETRPHNNNRHTFRDAEGMRAVRYHRLRIIDSIKRWWHKGEDFLKSISRR